MRPTCGYLKCKDRHASDYTSTTSTLTCVSCCQIARIQCRSQLARRRRAVDWMQISAYVVLRCSLSYMSRSPLSVIVDTTSSSSSVRLSLHSTSHPVSLYCTLHHQGLTRHLTCNDTPIHVATFTYLLQRYLAN